MGKHKKEKKEKKVEMDSYLSIYSRQKSGDNPCSMKDAKKVVKHKTDDIRDFIHYICTKQTEVSYDN